MSENLLEFADNDEKAGFRLERLELFNWGTFDRRVWTLNCGGENTLLTGDIGSGKSTLVDAVTTLLVPSQKITFNKAAGAESKERTLRSYVLGHYKSERSESGLAAKAVALRDHNAYTVLLAVFHNEGYNARVALAQVFWIRDQGQPSRFFVVADHDLSIAGDFSGFGTDLTDLRKRLRAHPGVEIHESFPGYGSAFRRRFGIDNEQALELFHQTVSMKSVGNLTDFVREHMLEAFDVDSRIEALIGHFDDLNRAHEAVQKAKRQVALLGPLVADGDRHAEIVASIEEIRAARDSLRPWFAVRKAGLLEKRLAGLEDEARRLTNRTTALANERSRLAGERDEQKRAVAENGGDRLERLGAEISAKQAEKKRRQERSERYRGFLTTLELEYPRDVDEFSALHGRFQGLREGLQNREAELQNARTENEVEMRRLRSEHRELQTELESLRRRRSNIPETQMALRAQLCTSLSLPEASMPFVGELLRVRPEEAAWEGAAERLLRNFGLSLLVPETCYPQVSSWVDKTSLRGRLVYFRVREGAKSVPELHPDSLVRKLVFKPDTLFLEWLESEISRRFDYACCETLEQFHRERQALTRSGQIKGGGERHEKDDRHALDDRSRFILGWTNEAKIKTLEGQKTVLERQVQKLADELSASQGEMRLVQEKLRDVALAEEFTDYTEIDWRALAVVIAGLETEKKALEPTSDRLKELARMLEETEKKILRVEADWDERRRDQARNEEKQEQARQLLSECREAVAKGGDLGKLSERLMSLEAELLAPANLTVESCDHRERELREGLQNRIDAEQKKSERLRDKIIDAMRSYCLEYPLETQETDVSIAGLESYRTMLAQLSADDLPRFEARFKALLNENTIREVANFQSQLARERQSIKERIERINASLTPIDYNPGRFIVLEAQPSVDPEIHEFRRDLQACTEGSLTGSEDEQYSEAKFLQVKTIIARFKGREGLTELDKRWTRKVTDVRQAFVFSASERWREDGTEFEHYTDSAGKSGGQKEKLAYTVLAASLAYQFGLEWGAVRSRSFRFVAIDEAFGKGSDESTRYGLELFRRLNLQLLIVTPLQKIPVIEPFVKSVGFVHNEDGRESKLRNLSIEAYRAERDRARNPGSAAP